LRAAKGLQLVILVPMPAFKAQHHSRKVVGGIDTMMGEMGPTIGVLFALTGGIAISMRRQKSKLADNDHVAV